MTSSSSIRPLRVPLLRLWLILWGGLFVLLVILFALTSGDHFSEVGLRGVLSPFLLGGCMFLSAFLSVAVILQFRQGRMTLPLSLPASAPLIAAAAARMKHTVETMETGEIVLRPVRSTVGAHPTIVVRPVSAEALRLEGPDNQLARLSRLLTGRRYATDSRPSLWHAAVFLLLGAGMLLDAVLILTGVKDCASLDLGTGTLYSAVGSGMRTLCERWGRFYPALIEALPAVLFLALAVMAWREHRQWKREPSGSMQ